MGMGGILKQKRLLQQNDFMQNLSISPLNDLKKGIGKTNIGHDYLTNSPSRLQLPSLNVKISASNLGNMTMGLQFET